MPIVDPGYYVNVFTSVKEVYEHVYKPYMGYVYFAIIVPAPEAGRRHRYHVHRINRSVGTIRRIGCELTLVSARAIARRHPARDGAALDDEELADGRWTPKQWLSRRPV
jgi:hypothetical protein